MVGVWAAAEGVVGDLGSLGVADDHELGVGAAGVEAVDCGRDSRDAGSDRGIVACSAA